MRPLFSIFLVVPILSAALGTLATPAVSRGDERAVRAAAEAYLAAVGRRDYAAAADSWTATGEYIDATGVARNAKQVFGRLAVEQPKASAGSASEAGKSLKTTVRMVASDMAIESGELRREASTSVGPGGGRSLQVTAVWVLRDGRWLLDGLRESVESTGELDPRLEGLGWLLGEWVASSDDGEVVSSTRAAEGGKFLERSFLIRAAGRVPMGATQRIGWDPESKRLKAWVFDTKGGVGQGIWSQEGQRWRLDMTHVQPSGAKAVVTSYYTLTDSGRLLWETPPIAGVPAKRVEFRRPADQQ
jgi:ketosteroid isomerase-like protein